MTKISFDEPSVGEVTVDHKAGLLVNNKGDGGPVGCMETQSITG